MDEFPELVTKRLKLNQLSWKDTPTIVEYAGNKKIADYTLNIPHPYQEEDAIFWINAANQGFKKKIQYTFAIRLKEEEKFIGGIGLKVNLRFNSAELGYWIAELFWNKGYATEAVQTILKFAFEEANINKVVATHLTNNVASGKVMIKNRMIQEGELKDHIYKENNYQSLVQYRLTKSEYSDKKF